MHTETTTTPRTQPTSSPPPLPIPTLQPVPEISVAALAIIPLVPLNRMPKRGRVTLLHQPFSIPIRTPERGRIPARIGRHQLGIVEALCCLSSRLVVRGRMHLVGSVLAGRSAVVFGAWTAEED